MNGTNAIKNENPLPTITGTWVISYNGENRPVRFENEETGAVIECGYDFRGRRFSKKVSVSGTVSLNQRYVYREFLQIACEDLSRAAQPALWFVLWDPTESVATRPLAIQKDGTWFTFGWDITKNVWELFGPAGYIRTTYSYEPFGNVSMNASGVVQPFRFSSEFYDEELDLVYYNYRHYSPTLGRFLSRDPIEEFGGLNLYAFVGNNSVSSDINGLIAQVQGLDLLLNPVACCGGKQYSRIQSCCIRDEDGTERLVSRKETVASEVTYVELRGRWSIPWLLQHAWLEAPFFPGKGAVGFYPKNKTAQPISFPGGVYPEDDPKNEYDKWDENSWVRTKSKRVVELRVCDYDVYKFNECVNKRVQHDMKTSLNYIVLVYRDCEIWANDVISDCKNASARNTY